MPEELSAEQLARLLILCEKATPGPWECDQSDWADGAGFWWRIMAPGQDGRESGICELADTLPPQISWSKNQVGEIPTAENLCNAELIAISRTAIPGLLDHIAAREARHARELAEVRAELKEWQDYWGCESPHDTHVQAGILPNTPEKRFLRQFGMEQARANTAEHKLAAIRVQLEKLWHERRCSYQEDSYLDCDCALGEARKLAGGEE